MANLSDLLPDVLPDLPGCPNITALDALSKALIEFCERSRYWREWLADIAVTAGDASYTPTVPTDSRLVDILAAEFADVPIDPASPAELDEALPGWRTDTGTVDYFTQPTADTLLLAKVPSASGTLKLEAALAPTLAATTFPDDIYQRFREAIACGAKARLMLSPGKPYTNPALHATHKAAFEDAIHDAEITAARGKTRMPLRTKLWI